VERTYVRALAQELGHPFTLGQASWEATILHRFQRDVHRTYDWTIAVLRLETAQGSQYLVTASTVLRGWVLAIQGRVDEGITQIGEGVAACGRSWRSWGSNASAVKVYRQFRIF
jgi:hypothetical protein